MSSPHVRIVYWVLVVGFLLIPNLCAFLLARSSSETAREAEVLERAAEFSTTAPFAAPANPVSPSGKTVLSPAYRTPCLAYLTSVKLSVERRSKGADGKETTRSEQRVLEQLEDQVDDLQLRFGSADIRLRLSESVRLPAPQTSMHASPPDFLQADRVPRVSGHRTSYLVSESILVPGQSLFVAGRVNAEGTLEAHPELGQILLFAGDREQCLQQFRATGRNLRWASYALTTLSLLVCAGLTFGFRKFSEVSDRK